MSTYRGLFNLLDENSNMIDGFEPLTTYGTNTIHWNDESTMFVIAIDQFNYGYFFVKVPELEFAFIKVPNPYPLDVCFENNLFVLSYNDNSLSTKNSVQTFGGGALEIPSKIYLKPQDLQIPLGRLTFYPRARLCDFELLTQKDDEYQMEPIDGGFRDFKGKFPQHTSEIYNTRQFEVYQLEAFAEYSDPQSIQWLDDIKKKTNGNYSKWKKVADYIGHQKRRIPLQERV